MAFSIHVVVRVTCQSPSWFVCASTEKRRERLSERLLKAMQERFASAHRMFSYTFRTKRFSFS